MNKAQLIDCVQKKLGDDVSKLAAERSVDAVLSAIKLGMRTDKEVQLVGFGSYQEEAPVSWKPPIRALKWQVANRWD